MKQILITIAALVLVGCGPSEAERALLIAAKVGDIEEIKQHLAAGTDVNAKDKYGVTPLHYTALMGYKEVGELLIANGADVNAHMTGCSTPLDSAIKYKYPVLADLLRKHGGKTAEELKAAGN